MSFKDGNDAIHLRMPDRVPRMEFSAEMHWSLIKAVTGIDVSIQSSHAMRQNAAKEFMKAWNYDFIWNILIDHDFLGDFYTDMGHADYMEGGEDYHLPKESKFKTDTDVLSFDPLKSLKYFEHKNLIALFNKNYDEKISYFPDAVNMTGTYISCMSGLIDLFGWDLLLMACGTDSKAFGEMTNRYALWMQQYFDALADSRTPIVMIHDDIVWTEGAFIHPDWYRTYIFPNYKKYLRPLIESGKKIIFTSDGNYTQFIDDIADCGFHGFVMEPLTDMEYVAEKYGNTHVFVGNADTRALLLGSKDDIYAEVKRCMDIGKKYPGYFMNVGNHIPPNTPVDNALWYNECYEKMARR
ncbi:hypothetical protein MASR2M78_01850 [Treponema sp.]